MRCGDNLNSTRRVRYVESGDIGTRYVAVRRDDGRKYMVPQTRYVAVRSVERVAAPRYVAVRRAPAYADSGVRYVAVRNAPTRVKYVAVRDVDIESPRYVAVRRSSGYDNGSRYIAVRNVDSDYYAPRTKYVAVRNIDNGYRQVVVRDNDLDLIEAPAPRHVVVRTDYIDGTEEVIVPNSSYAAPAEYLAVQGDDVLRPNYVAYSDANYVGRDDGRYVITRDMETPCMRQVAMRSCPEAISTREVEYVSASYDDDLYDQAILDEAGTTYVAADDAEYACLKPSGYRTSPMASRAVSYVPVEYADDPYMDEVEYVVEQPRARNVRYIADDDYIVESEPVQYVSVDEIEYIDDLDTPEIAEVSYAPVERVDYTNVAYVAADNCLLAPNDMGVETRYVAEAPSTVLVEVDDAEAVAGLGTTQRIASGFGYRDGFEDGQDDADDNDAFDPESEGDFRNGANGYEDEFGPKDVYRDEYRQSYLEGYRSGYKSLRGSV